jgi:hypothetical protein
MKFPVYEYLLLLNQNLAETVRILRNIRICPGISQDWFKYYEVQIEELRAEASGDVLNAMGDLEQKEGVRYGKQRRAFERTLADPDDVYIDVMKREEERRKQGLPPRIGVMSFASPGVLDNEAGNPDFDLSQSTGPPTKAAKRSTGKKSKKGSVRRKPGDLI